MSPFPPKIAFTWIWRWIFPPALASNSNSSFRIMVFSSPFTLSAFQGRSSVYWLIAAIFKHLLQLINVVGFSVYAMCTLHEPEDIHVDMKKLPWQYKHLSNMWQSCFRGKEWSFETARPWFQNSTPRLERFYQFRTRDFTSKKFRAPKL